MNANLPASHPSVDYYDSDYPGVGTSIHPENLDQVLQDQGLAHDIDRYLELAGNVDGPILELCCGTGRVAIPLARAGHCVVAVDISAAMLDIFRRKLPGESAETQSRVELVQQDVRQLALERAFDLVILSFNSLLLFTTRRDQQAVLACAAHHLERGARVAIDAVNPLVLPVQGDLAPRPFFTRRHPQRNRLYTRFAALGPFDAEQCQSLFGWYDEIDEEGRVLRTPYSMRWRPIFRGELELMLEASGLEPESFEGGHRHEPFAARSPRMFVVARRTDR